MVANKLCLVWLFYFFEPPLFSRYRRHDVIDGFVQKSDDVLVWWWTHHNRHHRLLLLQLANAPQATARSQEGRS
jgi:hypothetical protein